MDLEAEWKEDGAEQSFKSWLIGKVSAAREERDEARLGWRLEKANADNLLLALKAERKAREQAGS